MAKTAPSVLEMLNRLRERGIDSREIIPNEIQGQTGATLSEEFRLRGLTHLLLADGRILLEDLGTVSTLRKLTGHLRLVARLRKAETSTTHPILLELARAVASLPGVSYVGSDMPQSASDDAVVHFAVTDSRSVCLLGHSIAASTWKEHHFWSLEVADSSTVPSYTLRLRSLLGADLKDRVENYVQHLTNIVNATGYVYKNLGGYVGFQVRV